jgi:hypothetical protein
LIAAPQEKAKRERTRSRTFRVVATVAAAFAVSMASTDVPLSVAEYAIGDTVVISGPVGATAAMPDDAAPDYWPKLVALVRAGPTLPPDDTSGDPLPIA